MAVITIREQQPTENGFAASLIFDGGEYPFFIHSLLFTHYFKALREARGFRPNSLVMVRKRFDKAASVAANMAESPVINLLVVIARQNEEYGVSYS